MVPRDTAAVSRAGRESHSWSQPTCNGKAEPLREGTAQYPSEHAGEAVPQMLGAPVLSLTSWYPGRAPTPTPQPGITYLGARLLLSSCAARFSTGPSESRGHSPSGKQTENFTWSEGHRPGRGSAGFNPPSHATRQVLHREPHRAGKW